MLNSTFILFDGVGLVREKQLWLEGVTTLDEFEQYAPTQYRLFDDQAPSRVRGAKEAIRTGDANFFARRLSPRDYYRIALQFPNDVVFLDIETTGLSLYYDKITVIGWSINGEYKAYVIGSDETEMLHDLSRAKLIVTFNGTLFDLKFIRQRFPDIQLPEAHIDLRYFTRRVGLAGGQKKIEQEIGVVRQSPIKELRGETAPVLWHQYRRGSTDALEELIQYNHADVEGMKSILDYCVSKFAAKEDIPESILPHRGYPVRPSKLVMSRKADSGAGVSVTPFAGSSKPLVTYADLSNIRNLEHMVVVGIDLVSSEDRESGFCILNGSRVETSREYKDQHMIDLVSKNNAMLVSIDSPLSIPKGRTSFFDDDPMREKHGITRECERALAKRGVKSYPCLIQSMQKLTRRGMELAQKLRREGIPVIESYPGAAQDILQIPRKQAGLDHLTTALSEFGLTGRFTTKDVSHDELDAITSAIVGYFFWVGKFEALGNPDEDYLIIPDLEADSEIWLNRSVVGLTGHIAAGKTTVANYLNEKRGYAIARYSMVLEDLLNADGKTVNRASLQALGTRINAEGGQRWMGKKVLDMILESRLSVIDGVRFPDDRAFLIEAFGPSFKLHYVEAAAQIREQRMLALRGENISFRHAAKSMTEREISGLKNFATTVLKNNSTLEALYNQVDTIF